MSQSLEPTIDKQPERAVGPLEQNEIGAWRAPVFNTDYSDTIALLTMFRIVRGLVLEGPGVLSYAVRRTRKEKDGSVWIDFRDLLEEEARVEHAALAEYFSSKDATKVVEMVGRKRLAHLNASVEMYHSRMDTVINPTRDPRPPRPDPAQ